ncbi:MAG: AAA family ATPase [Chloroflexi bacterium]|nr:AAA family ATPase [Chloroflexota bacterium]
MDYHNVVEHLKQRIINQDEAISQVAEALVIAQAKLNEPDKPLCVLLFLGPTGIGKTETVRVLAEAIHGSTDEYCRIDMSSLSESHYAASLSGSPPGYIGSQENETMLDKKKIEGQEDRPGILLLDEIEKAHPSVHQSLLQIFDNARIRLANGRTEISFANTIIVMTSNAGSHALKTLVDHQEMGFKRLSASCPDDEVSPERDAHRKRVAIEALEHTFRPEFLNRIDGVVVFRWLNRQDMAEILDNLVAELSVRLQEHHEVRLELTPEAKALLVEKGFDQKFGARQLKRTVRNLLNRPLSQLMVTREVPGEATIVAQREGDALRFEVVPGEAAVVPAEASSPSRTRPRTIYRHNGPAFYPFAYQIPARYARPRFH